MIILLVNIDNYLFSFLIQFLICPLSFPKNITQDLIVFNKYNFGSVLIFRQKIEH